MVAQPARSLSRRRVIWWCVLALALLPALWGVGAILSDYFRGTRHLGSDPIKALEHFYGNWTLRFLVATLLVTPLRRTFGWNWLQPYRRRLGLVAFTYACLHLLTYAVLDMELTWHLLVEDLTERTYIIVGMSAFALLTLLALTSSAAAVRWLGRWWVWLHRLVYVAVVLGTVHFWMSVKRDIREPAIYAVVFSLLLAYRAWHSLRSRWLRPASKRSPSASSAHSA
jgi:sulfoxide reductase heme-binding subunit YedZ